MADCSTYELAEQMFKLFETEHTIKMSAQEFDARGGREGIKKEGLRLSVWWGDWVLLVPLSLVE